MITRALPTSDFGGHVRAWAWASLQSAPGSFRNGTFGRRMLGSSTRALEIAASPVFCVTIAVSGGCTFWPAFVLPRSPAIM